MPYPPHDFKCPYEHTCPYLNFMSTRWVFSQYNYSQDEYQKHLEIIDRFQESLKERDEQIRKITRENAELKAKAKMLHERQFKPNKKGHVAKCPSPPQGNLPEKKRRGAPPGHPGWQRPKPQHIDQTISVAAPTICPYCSKKGLMPSRPLREHIQEDIVLEPRTVITRYLHEQAFCSTCNRLVVQADENEILNAPIGPVAKSVAIYLRYGIGISYRKTTQLLDQVAAFFKDACATGAKLKSGDIPWPEAEGIAKRLVKRLSKICKKPLAFKPAETLRTYLAGADQKYLFTFLRHPSVPPTNNHAEQSIRHLVIFRKTSFGTRSENGLRAHSVLPSLVQTARRQGVHPRQFLQTLLTASTPDAQAALYQNSS